MKSQFALLIGRWQILHRGHEGMLAAALENAQRVLIVIGSAYRSRDTRNPFTWEERKAMWLSMLSPADRSRVDFLPVRDYYDDDRWNAAVGAAVNARITHGDSVTLVGWKKDQTSYYLDNFPEWASLSLEPTLDIDATGLRAVLFGSGDLEAALTVLSPYVSSGVLNYLDAWCRLPVFEPLRAEYAAVVSYRKKYTAPFYLTADAVVTASGHVLLVRRGGDIGHGLWALPGGFLESNERFLAAAIRELREETGLSPLAVSMRLALRGQAVFDHPQRSPRGRIVTTAVHFDFKGMPCQEVKGSDDATEAKWFRIDSLPEIESQLFEDHSSPLDHFVGLFPKTGIRAA